MGALDEILARVSRLAPVHSSILFFAEYDGLYSSREAALLCRREDGSWGFPGGLVQATETIEQTARRSAAQLGYGDERSVSAWIEHDGNFVFIARIDQPFDVGRGCNWTNVAFALDCPLRPAERAALEQLGKTPSASARADSAINSKTGIIMSTQLESLQREFEALKRKLGASMSEESRGEYAKAQTKAERVYQCYGDAAPSPAPGERLLDYRARLAAPYQKHSQTYMDSNLTKIGDPSAFTVVENLIYSDAMAALNKPGTGQLRAIVTSDPSGRPITRYVGDENACWDQFNPPVRYVRRILTSGQKA